MESSSPSVVGFIGLDELSLELASSLLRSGYKVQAFEVFEPLMDEFLKLGGAKCASPVEAVRDAAASVVLMCASDQMVNTFLGKEGALTGLQKDAIIILRSTISLAYMQKLEKNLTGNLCFLLISLVVYVVPFIVLSFIGYWVIEGFTNTVVAWKNVEA